MTNNLTKIASLPSGGGCMSAQEEAPVPKKYGPSMTHQEMAAHIVTLMEVCERLLERVGDLESRGATVQMKAPYFDETKDWTPVYYKADLDKVPSEPNTPASEEAAKRLGYESFNYTERS